ncbi:hypothetical protein RND71_019613 [Anisodus tanguticus]|uniref:Uncharacterized protein n=1 Tax=Anisodus tanguticus TaxID=243964 RepID=A0AAE1RZF7_9SOLA|nr:hypothetical protein RND71_019613 [Anisodus tanguticus]
MLHDLRLVRDEVPAKVENTVKDCGVGPSGTSDGDSDSEEEASDFVIPPDTNVVEINDDQTTPVAPRRGAILYLCFCMGSAHVYTDDDDHLASSFLG